MEQNEVTNVVVSIDGKDKFRLVVNDARKHLWDLVVKGQIAEIEPIIVTDNGIESEAWWEDDSSFVFDLVSNILSNGQPNDWVDGLEEFAHKILDTEACVKENKFVYNGRVLKTRPSCEDLSALGKVCGLD